MENRLIEPSRLFVYGIFLGKNRRDEYGMYNERYDTVHDYTTRGRYIVEAHYDPGKGYALTGLTVDVDPKHWDAIDALEWGYERILVTTVSGETLWMYAEKETRQ